MCRAPKRVRELLWRVQHDPLHIAYGVWLVYEVIKVDLVTCLRDRKNPQVNVPADGVKGERVIVRLAEPDAYVLVVEY